MELIRMAFFELTVFFVRITDFAYFPSISRAFRSIYNKTGTRQCTRAVWSTFPDIHSTHPGALMHYLGSLEFPVRIYDASDITTHTRPT